MSEQEPAPKPQPPKEAYDYAALARLEAAFAEPAVDPRVEPQVDEAPAFTFVDKRNLAAQAYTADMDRAKLVGATSFDERKKYADLSWAEDMDQKKREQDALVSAPAPVSVMPEAPVAQTKSPDVVVVQEVINAPKAPEVPAAPVVVEALAATDHAIPQRGKAHTELHTLPSHGIYRNGDRLRYAGKNPDGSNAANLQAYIKQTGVEDPSSAAKHYDEVNGLNEAQPETSERPSYATMDTDQLVFTAAKAEMIGDTSVADEIRETIEEEYTRPDGKMSYDDYQSAIERFDHLLELATEYEKAKDPDHSALVDATVERVNKEPSIGDKLKGWWSKSTKKLLAGSFWKERFATAKTKTHDASTWALNLGVNTETDTPEEIDKKQNRNRVRYVAGGMALAAVALVSVAYGVGYSVGGSEQHVTNEVVSTSPNVFTSGAGDTLSPLGSASHAGNHLDLAPKTVDPTDPAFTLKPIQ